MKIETSIKIDIYDLVREIARHPQAATPFLTESGRNAKREIAKAIEVFTDHARLQAEMPWIAEALSEVIGKSADGKSIFFDANGLRRVTEDLLVAMTDRKLDPDQLKSARDNDLERASYFLQIVLTCAAEYAPEAFDHSEDFDGDPDDGDDEGKDRPEPTMAPEGKIFGSPEVVAVKTGTAGICSVIHITDEEGAEHVVTFTGEGAMLPVQAIAAMEGLFPVFAARVGPGGQGLAFSISCKDEDPQDGPGFMDL